MRVPSASPLWPDQLKIASAGEQKKDLLLPQLSDYIKAVPLLRQVYIIHTVSLFEVMARDPHIMRQILWQNRCQLRTLRGVFALQPCTRVLMEECSSSTETSTDSGTLSAASRIGRKLKQNRSTLWASGQSIIGKNKSIMCKTLVMAIHVHVRIVQHVKRGVV